MIARKIIRQNYPTASVCDYVCNIEKTLQQEGFIVITDTEPIGIVTCRSMQRLRHTSLSDCIHKLPTITPETHFESILEFMNQNGTDVLPVFKQKKFVGVVLLKDLAESLLTINRTYTIPAKQKASNILHNLSDIPTHDKQMSQVLTQKLIESEHTFKTIITMAPTAIGIHDGKRMNYLNRSAKRLLTRNNLIYMDRAEMGANDAAVRREEDLTDDQRSGCPFSTHWDGSTCEAASNYKREEKCPFSDIERNITSHHFHRHQAQGKRPCLPDNGMVRRNRIRHNCNRQTAKPNNRHLVKWDSCLYCDTSNDESVCDKWFNSVIRSCAVGKKTETCFVHKDGSKSFWEIITYPHPVFGTKLFISFFSDITKQEKLSKNYEKVIKRFHLALKNSSIAVFAQDRDLRYTWIYNAHKDFIPEDVLGKTDMDLLPHEDAVALASIKQKVIRSGQHARERVCTTINGKKHFYELTIEPTRNGRGKVNGVLCAASDITALIVQVQALSKSKENFILLADSISEIFFALDRSLRITYWGKVVSHLSQVSPKNAIGKKLSDVYDSDPSRIRNDKIYRNVIKTQKARRTKYRYRGQIYELNVYPFSEGVSVIARNRSDERMFKNREIDLFNNKLIAIAQQIHNGIGQYMSALAMRCAELQQRIQRSMPISFKDIESLHTLCNTANESVQDLIQSFLLKAGENDSDHNTIQHLCKTIENNYDVIIAKDISEPAFPSNNFDRHHIIRFIQEALTNAAKHSGVKEIKLSILNTSKGIVYKIFDPGHGFDASMKTPGMGLKLMRFNADEVAGVFKLDTGTKGTTCILRIPHYRMEI